MLVDRAHTEVAAARHRDACAVAPAEQRTKQIVRSAHIPRQLVRDDRLTDIGGVDLDSGAVEHPHLCAQRAQDFEKDRNIADIGNIFNDAFALRQNSGRNDRNSSIFCAANDDLAFQTGPAFNNIFFQVYETSNILPHIIPRQNQNPQPRAAAALYGFQVMLM